MDGNVQPFLDTSALPHLEVGGNILHSCDIVSAILQPGFSFCSLRECPSEYFILIFMKWFLDVWRPVVTNFKMVRFLLAKYRVQTHMQTLKHFINLLGEILAFLAPNTHPGEEHWASGGWGIISCI